MTMSSFVFENGKKKLAYEEDNTYSFDYCTGLCITAFIRTITQGGVLTIEWEKVKSKDLTTLLSLHLLMQMTKKV